MSEQDKAFEKWYAETWNITVEQMHKKPNGYYIYKPTQGAYEAWQAATLESAERIAALESDLINIGKENADLSFLNDALQAINHDLREALLQASRHLDLLAPNSTACKIVSEALSATPAESLAKHTNETIEKCAVECEIQVELQTSSGGDESAINQSKRCRDAIRALKSTITVITDITEHAPFNFGTIKIGHIS